MKQVHLYCLLLTVVSVTNCRCSASRYKRPYPKPTVEQALDTIAATRAAAHAFRSESVMDYWVGGNRVKGTVLVMGRIGAFIRVNAENPAGGSVASDLACDGTRFQFIDYNENCQLAGVCSRLAIARLLRVSLDPDDFLLLAVGSTPVIDGARKTLEWDAKNGHEIVKIIGDDGLQTQTIVFDGRAGNWDVLRSTVRDSKGKLVWTMHNKDFHVLKSEDGREFRVPEKTRFEQPQQKADLIVTWQTRAINVELSDDKFEMEIPPGLKRCQ